MGEAPGDRSRHQQSSTSKSVTAVEVPKSAGCTYMVSNLGSPFPIMAAPHSLLYAESSPVTEPYFCQTNFKCVCCCSCWCCCAGASSWFFGAIQFPSAYSNPSAPGLLVASGNVAGEGYGLDDNDGCVWLQEQAV
jgi:hypothetical protein